jgi:hypothetical protein
VPTTLFSELTNEGPMNLSSNCLNYPSRGFYPATSCGIIAVPSISTYNAHEYTHTSKNYFVSPLSAHTPLSLNSILLSRCLALILVFHLIRLRPLTNNITSTINSPSEPVPKPPTIVDTPTTAYPTRKPVLTKPVAVPSASPVSLSPNGFYAAVSAEIGQVRVFASVFVCV